MKEEKSAKQRASLISARVKKLATLATVVVGGLAFGSSAQASVDSPGSIADRVAKVRQAVVEKATQHNAYLPGQESAPETVLARWGNWGNWANWANWDNWNNWSNWGNAWGNVWGNY
jgi:hypothetical protein